MKLWSAFAAVADAGNHLAAALRALGDTCALANGNLRTNLGLQPAALPAPADEGDEATTRKGRGGKSAA